MEYFKVKDSWLLLIRGDCSAMTRWYWLNADRHFWNVTDPGHVTNALFAIGNILNFTRLFQLMAISEHLGPMLISLERMIKVSCCS